MVLFTYLLGLKELLSVKKRHHTLFWNETEDEFRVESTSRLELRMNPDMFDSGDEGADYKCPRKLADVSLQCEACGPDLELYDMLR